MIHLPAGMIQKIKDDHHAKDEQRRKDEEQLRETRQLVNAAYLKMPKPKTHVKKTRAPHVCEHCGTTITKGSPANKRSVPVNYSWDRGLTRVYYYSHIVCPTEA